MSAMPERPGRVEASSGSDPAAGTGGRTAGRLRQLRGLTVALADAVTPDDVARAVLRWALELEGVARCGLAVSQGAGRELTFVASDDDAINATPVRWCQIDGLADVPLAQAVRSGLPVHVSSLADMADRYPHLVDRQRGLGTRSLAALPLVASTGPLGGLLLAFDTPRRFDDDEQAFLAAFAAQVSQALRRGLAFQTQQTVAELLQRSLLPDALPELAGLDLGAHYEPGGKGVDVGGDWYDVLGPADGSVGVALGDVMGKGVPAAIVMGQVRAALRAYALLDPDPSTVLERLDALVTSLGAPEQIVTVAYGLVDPNRTAIDVAVAGHPPPLRLPVGADSEVLDVPPGPPLGLGAGPWRSRRVSLHQDAQVLFYSDGLVESRELGLEQGIARLQEAIATIATRRRDPRELCARLAELMRRPDADDDTTMLAIMTTVGRPQRTASAEFRPDPTATPAARHFLVETLAGWTVPEEVAETAQLCLSELVTNAVIHSGTPTRVTVRLDDDRLLVLVQDGGHRGTARRREDHEPEDISGRGLLLVEAMSSAWSAEHSADGTTVWFELELPGSAR